jgi:FMN phosphatase YigB (HAD superfamily)
MNGEGRMTAAAGARERLRPQAITFDFYGTLMNSKETEIEAFAQIIRWNGCPEDDAERFYDRWLLHCQAAYWGRYRTYRRPRHYRVIGPRRR